MKIKINKLIFQKKLTLYFRFKKIFNSRSNLVQFLGKKIPLDLVIWLMKHILTEFYVYEYAVSVPLLFVCSCCVMVLSLLIPLSYALKKHQKEFSSNKLKFAIEITLDNLIDYSFT